jgi:hypothetical protein
MPLDLDDIDHIELMLERRRMYVSEEQDTFQNTLILMEGFCAGAAIGGNAQRFSGRFFEFRDWLRIHLNIDSNEEENKYPLPASELPKLYRVFKMENPSKLKPVNADRFLHPKQVWVFNSKSGFPGGVFSSQEKAEELISSHKLSGMLTSYPVDWFVYDWAIAEGYFTPKSDRQKEPDFIGGFTSASQEHFHYENGECE